MYLWSDPMVTKLKPLVQTIGKAVKFYTERAIGNAFKEQVIKSGNIFASDILLDDDLKEGHNREAKNIEGIDDKVIKKLIDTDRGYEFFEEVNEIDLVKPERPQKPEIKKRKTLEWDCISKKASIK